MRWSKLLLLAVILVGSPVAASTDGSWVLWIKHLPQGSHGYWDLWATYPSRTACQEARRKVIYDSLVRDMLRREQFKTEEELQRETERIVAGDDRHQCLPDTIDPRE